MLSDGLISHLQADGAINKKPTRKVKVSKKQTTHEPYIDFSVFEENGNIEIILPIQTFSEANGGNKKVKVINGKKIYKTEHWSQKNKRLKKQKWWVEFAFTKPETKLIKLPCEITMIRYASKFLDEEDNLRMALKPLKDYIAAEIMQDFCPGRADGSKQLKWHYDQVISKQYYVKIIITF